MREMNDNCVQKCMSMVEDAGKQIIEHVCAQVKESAIKMEVAEPHEREAKMQSVLCDPQEIDPGITPRKQQVFLIGQPVELVGLKAAHLNGKAGLVSSLANAEGRFGVLLWSETRPKAILPVNLANGNPEVRDVECADCGTRVRLDVMPPCRCDKDSLRLRLLDQFKQQIGFSAGSTDSCMLDERLSN